jgi:hypothetical protein
MMHEDIIAASFTGDETKALLIVEPLDSTFFTVTHCWKTPFPTKLTQLFRTKRGRLQQINKKEAARR